MADEYSIYDAKAQLSSLVRQVREGSTFVITVRGEPVAELRPISQPDRAPQTLAERIAELRAAGEIVSAPGSDRGHVSLPPADNIPGALQRFLDDRE